jgi:glycosyltransferase involved in cell wall biosynthesis
LRKSGLFGKIIDLTIKIIDFVLNKKKIIPLRIIKRILLSFRAELIYLVEEANWAIEWVGRYITNNLKNLYSLNIEIGSQYFARNKIIHYGEITCLVRDNAILNLKKSNIQILTLYHIPSYKNLNNLFNYLNLKIDLIHTSNNITKQKLIQYGIERNKIIKIPLGVDLSTFKRFNQPLKLKIKKKLNLPIDKIIIGSFQQDCWKNGIPVQRKGPDIFCEVLKKLNEKYEIHILLTGPGRIYVKRRLKENNISYTHIYLNKYSDMVYCYNVLDIYIITSRIEGGPLALLESMATGVPVVTTKVGMAPEVIKNNINGLIVDIDDVEKLFQSASFVINNKELRDKIINNALKAIKYYSWERIANQYYSKLYKQFL